MYVPDGAVIISGPTSDINSEHAACKQNSLVRTQLPKLKKRIVLEMENNGTFGKCININHQGGTHETSVT